MARRGTALMDATIERLRTNTAWLMRRYRVLP